MKYFWRGFLACLVVNILLMLSVVDKRVKRLEATVSRPTTNAMADRIDMAITNEARFWRNSRFDSLTLLGLDDVSFTNGAMMFKTGYIIREQREPATGLPYSVMLECAPWCFTNAATNMMITIATNNPNALDLKYHAPDGSVWVPLWVREEELEWKPE